MSVSATPPPRIAALDHARSLALLGMGIFHFTFDLMLFGYLPPGTVYQGIWPWVARGVASSFLFLAGVSLWLAHGRAIRWPAFWRRFAMVAGAALLVTVATFFTLGAAYIRWGILHMIAAGSLLALPFLRLPVALTLAVAAGAFAAPHLFRAELFNGAFWLWLGLAREVPPMVDYLPILPWLCPLLLGLAFARLADGAGLWARLAPWQPGRLGQWLAWPGRHSLAIYLLHQPVLFGLIWAFTTWTRA